MVHDFAQCLKASHAAEDMPWWGEVYRSAFPTMRAMVNVRQDGEHQRAGIDRIVILESSKSVAIDEKVRTIPDTSDIMLEFVSNDRTNSPGWVAKHLLCDYVAYAFAPSGTCYLLPTIQLQAAWQRHGGAWQRQYGVRRARNRTYSSLNCPVPISVLFSAMGQFLRITFNVPTPGTTPPPACVAPTSPPPPAARKETSNGKRPTMSRLSLF